MGTKYLHTSHSSCIHKSTYTQGALSAPLLSSRLQSDKLAAWWLLASVPPNSGVFLAPFSPPAGEKVLETVSGTSWSQNSSCLAHTQIHPHRQITKHIHETTGCKCIHIHSVWSLRQRTFLNGPVSRGADRVFWDPSTAAKFSPWLWHLQKQACSLCGCVKPPSQSRQFVQSESWLS